MTKDERELIDNQVFALIKAGKAVTATALQASTSQDMRTIDRSLQRLRSKARIEFKPLSRTWEAT